MWDYTAKVKEHFLNPRNVGEIKNPDAVAEVGNMSCGDALKLYLKVDENQKIIDAKFQTFGCASAIASSSALTEIIIGKTLEEASKITNADIVKYLGELPEAKIHCSVMGMEALQEAIANYHGKQCCTFDREKEEDGSIVCHCFGVTDVQIRHICRANNVHQAEDVKNYLKAGGGCGCCLNEIQKILDEMWMQVESETETQPNNDFQKLTPVQKIIKIQEVIEKEIKPILEKDGGSIEFLNFVNNHVQVRLHGACAGCPASHLTLKNRVQMKLQEELSTEIEIEEIRSQS